MKLVFSAEARANLLRIGDYIAQDNPARALIFVEELEARLPLIAAKSSDLSRPAPVSVERHTSPYPWQLSDFVPCRGK